MKSPRGNFIGRRYFFFYGRGFASKIKRIREGMRDGDEILLKKDQFENRGFSSESLKKKMASFAL